MSMVHLSISKAICASLSPIVWVVPGLCDVQVDQAAVGKIVFVHNLHLKSVIIFLMINPWFHCLVRLRDRMGGDGISRCTCVVCVTNAWLDKW